MRVETKTNIKYRQLMLTLFIVAFVCAIFGSVRIFFRNSWFEYSQMFIFEFPDIIDCIFMVIYLSPFIFAIVYFSFFYKKMKSTVILSLVFVSIAFKCLIYYPGIYIIPTDFRMQISSYMLEDYSTMFHIRHIHGVVNIILIITFLLATYGVLTGLSNKFIIVPALFVGIVNEIGNFCQYYIHLNRYERYYSGEQISYNNMALIGTIGFLLFYGALFIFCLINKVPKVIITKEKVNNNITYGDDTEEKLSILKSRYDAGLISEEEYKTLKMDIIEKL